MRGSGRRRGWRRGKDQIFARRVLALELHFQDDSDDPIVLLLPGNVQRRLPFLIESVGGGALVEQNGRDVRVSV